MKSRKAINIGLAVAFVFFVGCLVVISVYAIIDGAIPIRRAHPLWMVFFLGVVFPFSLPCFSTLVLFLCKEKRVLPMVFGLSAVTVGVAMCVHCLIELPGLIESSKTSEHCLSAALCYGKTKTVNYLIFNYVLFALLVLEALYSRFTPNASEKRRTIRILIYSLVGLYLLMSFMLIFFNSFGSIGFAIFGGIFIVMNIFTVAALLIFLAADNKRLNSASKRVVNSE